jgi:hypothetical protein
MIDILHRFCLVAAVMGSTVSTADNETGTRMALAKLAALVEARD